MGRRELAYGRRGCEGTPRTAAAHACPGPLPAQPLEGRAATHEAVLDFILSTLITPRTVSAVLHAAKKLVSASVLSGNVPAAPGTGTPELPPADADSQHGLALLNTALRAVETCLQVRRVMHAWAL